MTYLPPASLPARTEEAARLLLAALQACFPDDLRGVLLKGSTIKGDFVPGYSDLDLHVFLRPEAMIAPRAPHPVAAMRFQAAIGGLDPREFGCNSFQVIFLDWSRYPEDWARPVPGSYQVLLGELPPGFTEVSAENYRRHARAGLARLDRAIAQLIERAVDKPDRNLPPILRLAGIELKGAVYSAATLITPDPLSVWRQPLWQVLDLLKPQLDFQPALAACFYGLADWQHLRHQPERVRRTFIEILEALAALRDWAAQQPANEN